MNKTTLDFALANGFMLVNTFYGKREEHLVTIGNGNNKSRINILVPDIHLQSGTQWLKEHDKSRIKWWNLNGDLIRKYKIRYQKNNKQQEDKRVYGLRI